LITSSWRARLESFTQSVDHTDVTRELTVGRESKKHSINRVSSGNGAGFSVYLPNVPKQDPRWGVFEYQNSMIFFRAT